MFVSVKSTLPALIVVAAVGLTPAVAKESLASLQCLNNAGELQSHPGDDKYCSCVALLDDPDRGRLGIPAAQVDECALTTGSIANPDTIAPPDENTPPPDDGNPGDDGKGNNGVGNGVDPAPPGIGNEGNDAAGQTPGNPGGATTSPGNN